MFRAVHVAHLNYTLSAELLSTPDFVVFFGGGAVVLGW
jgi:hypothetical protein